MRGQGSSRQWWSWHRRIEGTAASRASGGDRARYRRRDGQGTVALGASTDAVGGCRLRRSSGQFRIGLGTSHHHLVSKAARREWPASAGDRQSDFVNISEVYGQILTCDSKRVTYTPREVS